jgi:hypothetical protein
MTIHIRNTDILINPKINFWMVFFEIHSFCIESMIPRSQIVSYHFFVSIQLSRPCLVMLCCTTTKRHLAGWIEQKPDKHTHKIWHFMRANFVANYSANEWSLHEVKATWQQSQTTETDIYWLSFLTIATGEQTSGPNVMKLFMVVIYEFS